MKWNLPTSVRLNLVLVVLVGVLPLCAVTLTSGLERRRNEIDHAKRTTSRLAEYYAFTQENEVRRIRTVLETLAREEAVLSMDLPACTRLLRDYLAANPNYGNFALVALDGDALATGIPYKRRNVGDRKEIREALATGELAVGEYSVGRVTKEQILPVALPVRDGKGETICLLLATLRLQEYSNIFEHAMLPPDSFAGFTDHKGVRLYRYPMKDVTEIGKPIMANVWEKLRSIGQRGMFAEKGTDGVRRIYAVRRLASRAGDVPYLNIFVGIPEPYLIAGADMVTAAYLRWLAVSLLLSAVLAWLVGKFGIHNRVIRLASVAHSLGQGNLAARSGLTETGGSLGKLAVALDTMASALERDIRARVEIERHLLDSRNEAEAANQAKSRFLANMSHEIRTPLNGIMGMLQLLKGSGLGEEQAEYAGHAIRSCGRLTQLLSDILDLTRVEMGRLEISSEPFDCADLLSGIEHLFVTSARQKGLELRFEVDPSIPGRLAGDPTRLHQILSNLVGNALKYTDAGRVDVRAVAMPPVHADKFRVLFIVSDTGQGIPDDQLDTIFESFNQGGPEAGRPQEGVGLGLAITKSLVSLMGGTIEVASEPGRGTSFHCCIPFRVEDIPPPRAGGDGHAGRARSGLAIVLAEDDLVSRIAVTAMLKKAGHVVTAVNDGRQALAALRENPVDLVLMDIQMPVMDGLEATKAIRDGEAGQDRKDVPIIAMTAYAMTGDRERLLESGMDDYVAKPVDMEALLQALDRAMEPRGGRT